MNQRLLERLKRHSDFPQLRPGVAASAQRGSIEPFGAGQPRLALAQQRSPNAPLLNSPQPLESELVNGFASFPEPDSSPFAQAEFLPDGALNAAQVDSAALEDFTAIDRSDFSESPFSVGAQTDPATNTEATINAPLGATMNPALSANSSTDSGANQSEALTARNPQPSSQPRLAEPSVSARSVPMSPPIAVTTMPSALETRVSAGTVIVNAGNVNAASSAEARSAPPAPSDPFAPQVATELSADDADFSISPSDISPETLSDTLPTTSSNAVSAAVISQADSEPIRPAAESASGFDRQAAMLELRELGVKVRVTLSNAALKAQLEAVRTAAPQSTATPAVAGGVPSDENTSAASALETRVGSDANSALEGSDRQLQPNSSTASLSRAPAASPSSPALEPVDASSAGRPRLEPASVQGELRPRSESPDAPTVNLENPVGSETGSVSAESSVPLEVNSTLELIAANGAEPAVYGTVAAVEVYNPPNRRAVAARPKATEIPKNEAERLFSTLPDSNPLEWLSRLNSAQALEVDASNAANLVRPLPEQSRAAVSDALENPARLSATPASTASRITAPTATAQIGALQTGATQTGTAQNGAAQIGVERTDAPLLPNLEASGNRERPQLESTRLTTPVAPRAAPEPTLPSALSPSRLTPQGVAGLAQSAGAASPTPIPTPTQRLAASDGNLAASPISGQESLVTTPTPEAAVTSEPSNRQSIAPERTDLELNRLEGNGLERNRPERTDLELNRLEGNGLERNRPERTDLELNRLEGAESQINGANDLSPLAVGLLSDGTPAQVVGQAIERQSMPRAATEVASDGRDASPTQTSRLEPRDPVASSQEVPSDALPNPVLSELVLSELAPASPTLSNGGDVNALTSNDPTSSSSAGHSINSTSSDLVPSAEPSSDLGSSAAVLADLTSRAERSSAPISSLGERGSDAARPVSVVPPVTVVDAPVVANEQPSAASSNDVAAQGTVVAVEVYNPPNRRAVAARPKAAETPKNEAERLFSTLPDSNPLEWLSRLNSAQALNADSSSPSVPTQGTVLSAGSAPDAVAVALSTAAAPGLRTAPDLSSARGAQISAPADSGSSLRAPVNPGQGTQPQMRGSLRESDPASAALGAQALAPNAQIGDARGTASLIATPPSAALTSGPRLIAQPTNAESPARETAQPVRLSSSAQRLIAPITGIDPNTVQIRRDAQSDALTKAYRADALTVNGTVLLSARLGAETPETLGVIAHELTHVARERSPRFVPPALRQSLLPANRGVPPSLEGQGEESIALQVEGFTRALAQQGMTLGSGSAASDRPVNGTTAANSRSLESVPWGDGVLPAPWELADRLEALTNPGLASARRQSAGSAAQQSAFQQTAFEQSSAPQSASSSASTRSDAPTFAGSSSNSSAPTAPASAASFAAIGSRSAPISVQAADQGRSVPTPSPAGPLPKSPEAAPKPASGAAPAPDLDDLARQVYAVLKRRLITERRRSS